MSQIQRIKKVSTIKLNKTKGSYKLERKIVKVATKIGYLSSVSPLFLAPLSINNFVFFLRRNVSVDVLEKATDVTQIVEKLPLVSQIPIEMPKLESI